jgi:hypothetical protein
VASDIVGLALPWPVAFAAEVLGPVRGEFLAELAYAFGMLAMAPALLFLAPVLIFAWLCSWLGRVKHPRPLLAVSWDLEVGGSSHVVSLPLPAGPTPAFVWLDGRQVPLDWSGEEIGSRALVELVDRPAILELVDARPPFIRSDRFWFVMILVFGEAAYSDPSEERCYRLTVENSTVRTVRLSGGERRTD